MVYKHTITPRDKWFLDKHMKDPVAQEPFKVGDTIVICAKCKTAHYDSSWSLNANKCCSLGCNYDSQLSFNKFSPAIFQPKASGNARFKVIIKKLPFGERLKLFNGYPLANIITILIPILVFVLMVYFTQYRIVPTFSTANLFEESQYKFVDVMTNSLSGFENIIKKPKSIDIDFGEMSYKLTMVSTSLNEVESKLKATKINDRLKSTNINDKFGNVGDNISKVVKHAEKKIIQLFDFVSQFFNVVFGQ